jgi:hypothetical protein
MLWVADTSCLLVTSATSLVWLKLAVVEMQSLAAEAAMLAAFVQLLLFNM